jgi:hypothetical protein
VVAIIQHHAKRLFLVKLERKFLVNQDVVSTVDGKDTTRKTVPMQESAATARAGTTNRYVHEIRKSKALSQPNSRKMKNLQRQPQKSARVLFYFKQLE